MFGYIGLRCLQGAWCFGFRRCLPVLILFWFIWSKVAHPCAKYLNPILPDSRMWNIWWWGHQADPSDSAYSSTPGFFLTATSIRSWILLQKNFRVPINCHNYACHILYWHVSYKLEHAGTDKPTYVIDEPVYSH